MENILDFFDEEWFKKAVVESRERGCTAFGDIARGGFYRDFDTYGFGAFKSLVAVHFFQEEREKFSEVVENVLSDKDFKRENKRAWQDVWLIATEIGLRNYYKHRGLKKKVSVKYYQACFKQKWLLLMVFKYPWFGKTFFAILNLFR